MAKKKFSPKPGPKATVKVERSGRRSFPHHTVEESLAIAQKIADEMADRPMNRLLLGEAVGVKPGSSNYRLMLSSAYKYGLIDGTEKSEEIGLTELGKQVTQREDPVRRAEGIRRAALSPQPIGRFLEDYKNRKLPSGEMLPKILHATYGVPKELAAECGNLIGENARFAGMLRDIGGAPHVLFEAGASLPDAKRDLALDDEWAEGDIGQPTPQKNGTPAGSSEPAPVTSTPIHSETSSNPPTNKPIFVGHGKNVIPLQKLEGLLSGFQIPYKVTIREANLGRPIPQKVKNIIDQCGSAILIFTKDEQFRNVEGDEIWRPSENVIHELGAASYAYSDRIVIFKEKGLHFPSNFQSIGYIEFEVDSIEAKTADLLKELIGFGLVRVLPT